LYVDLAVIERLTKMPVQSSYRSVPPQAGGAEIDGQRVSTYIKAAELPRNVVDPVAVREELAARFREVRALTEKLCDTLVTEDYVIQPMPDCSPAKWHLAHTSWFFETFVLKPCVAGYESPHPQYDYLFNSYYNAVGARHCRPKRGLISRPTVVDTYSYRAHVDSQLLDWLANAPDGQICLVSDVLTLGLHHEQQHQELLLTDIKNVFWENPLRPAYRLPQSAVSSMGSGSLAGMSVFRPMSTAAEDANAMMWVPFDGGLVWIGHVGDGFAFDNESPRHQEYLQPFQIGSRLVTSGEYCNFIEDGGYRRPEFWLAEGWTTVQTRGWEAPLYWERHDGAWWQFTLSGMRPVDASEPVCHVSMFEAEAFAAWLGARLPTEAEWETAAASAPVDGNFVDNELYHPSPMSCNGTTKPGQLYGDVWEWTQSSYSPYPGFHAASGALGEYNGKFMCNQYVLRGGSCATSRSHIRATYRNFFPADARWQFTGIRLAQNSE
jgi:ergothioneine biosynthesis protein EgtB